MVKLGLLLLIKSEYVHQIEKEYEEADGKAKENNEGDEIKPKAKEPVDQFEADKENLLNAKTNIPILNKIGIKDE
jgi:hypothetical protein